MPNKNDKQTKQTIIPGLIQTRDQKQKIKTNDNISELQDKHLEIEVAKKKYKASIEIKPLHDPKNISIKN